MALTPRKKKGVGLFITGGIFILFGAITTISMEDPSWLAFVPIIIGFFTDYFGFQVVFPDRD